MLEYKLLILHLGQQTLLLDSPLEIQCKMVPCKSRETSRFTNGFVSRNVKSVWHSEPGHVQSQPRLTLNKIPRDLSYFILEFKNKNELRESIKANSFWSIIYARI